MLRLAASLAKVEIPVRLRFLKVVSGPIIVRSQQPLGSPLILEPGRLPTGYSITPLARREA